MTWNRGAERIFGYLADEVIGKPITILIPKERHDEEPEDFSNVSDAVSASSIMKLSAAAKTAA